MRRRDRLRALLAPSATATRSTSPHLVPPAPLPTPPAQRSSPPPSSSAPIPIGSSGVTPTRTTARITALEKAVALHQQKLPEAERAAFQQEIKALDEQSLLSKVQAYDAEHKNKSSFRPHAERLTKVLGLLDRLMGGVAIGIQADPAISAPVVGIVRVAIDLGLQSTTFFPRLTDMICEFEDYLGPLAELSQATNVELVENGVVNVYTNILNFGWKARCIFIDANGERRRWTSCRAFMRQHWDTFEAEFVSMKGEMQHHLHVLQHTVQAEHFNAFRNAEQRKERSAFLSWVSDIDFEEVHQSIYAKKHKGTGDWLIKEHKFQEWMQDPQSSLLWCNGKPGIGKSVLSSNVLEHITAEAGLRKDTAICFAYYNYRDTRLAKLTKIISTLIKQLYQDRHDIPHNLLQKMRDAHSPSSLGSQACFLSIAESFSEVFVVFDALDECPQPERQAILDFITEAVTTPHPCRIKVFATSRREMDITEAFERNLVPTVQILAENVAADIETFARSKVDELRARKKLYVTKDELKEKIIQTLVRRAEGMFLWVNLQLENLCRASKARKDHVVEAALDASPQGLPDTYVRILERIEVQSPYMRDLALNCLFWIIYARRPLRTRELQHALALRLKCIDLQDLQIDPTEVILEACGNLLEEANGVIRPIHYTVQEFLTTDIQGPSQNAIRAQLLDSNSAHRQLGLACLAYVNLVAFCAPARYAHELYSRLGKYYLASYAFPNFDYHISNRDETSAVVIGQLDMLLRQESTRLAAILQIKILRDDYDYISIIQHFNPTDFLVTPSTIVYSTNLYNNLTVRQRWAGGTPPAYALHLASSAGLASAVIRLLEGGCDVDEKDESGSTPLYYTSYNGDVDILLMLIRKGANVNAQGGYFGNALQAASAKGYDQVVKILLNNNAEINAQGGIYSTALRAASVRGQEATVKLLLKKGADINAQDRMHGNALQVASVRGQMAIVKLLLEEGANVNANAQGGTYGNALQAASSAGHEATVKLLLKKGADVNAQGGYYGNALQAASLYGKEAIVELLLEEGANVNAQGGYYGNALQAASSERAEAIVKLLLEKGANINAQGGEYGNALQAASYRGYKAIVKLLLEKGANVNAQGGIYSNALQAASSVGHEATVKLLLEKGANITDKALQEASANGYEAIVKLLLEKGANINAQGGDYGNALQAASYRGRTAIVKLLLEKGANITDKAFQEASAKGHEAIVKLLLEKGANINAQGGEYGNALQAASYRGYKAIVKLLLEKGANVNAQGGIYSNALQTASSRGREAIVKLLLEKGANVNNSEALQDASFGGHEAIVKLLLEKGADVNALDNKSHSALLIASRQGQDHVVQILLNTAGIEVNPKDTFNQTPMLWAAAKGHLVSAQLLLTNGDVQPNVPDILFGQSPLLWAAKRGHLSVVELLISNVRINQDSKDTFGRTALWLAASNGYKKMVELLLTRCSLDPSSKDAFGFTLLSLTAARGETKIQHLLQKTCHEKGLPVHENEISATSAEDTSLNLCTKCLPSIRTCQGDFEACESCLDRRSFFR